MIVKVERPTEKHLKSVSTDYVTCYGDGGFSGHRVYKYGDLWWIVNSGWICRKHYGEGRADAVAKVVKWKEIREW